MTLVNEKEEANAVRDGAHGRNVVMIGVSGCSSSGKTTLARRLVELLQSPLRPISLDDFFDEAVCQELGTWEDPRCIRTQDYAGFLRAIRRQLESDGRCVDDCLQDVDGVSAYMRSRSARPLTTTTTITITTNTNTITDRSSFSDASSTEHVQELAETTTILDGVCVDDSTVYIVCEGFLLFVDETVCDLMDYYVIIDIDGETAALRRFLRPPRRYLRHRGYSERIEHMFHSRKNLLSCTTETRGNNALLPSLFEYLHSKLKYIPPRPSVPGNYERFWLQKEYLQFSPPPSPMALNTDNCNSLLSPYSWLEVRDPNYVTRTLQNSRLNTCSGNDLVENSTTPIPSSPSSSPTTGQSNKSSTVSASGPADRVSTLQEQYFEFRYWFFFEVLYYYRQLYHIMEEVLTRVCQHKFHGNDANYPILRLTTTGVGLSDPEGDEELILFVQHMIRQSQNG